MIARWPTLLAAAAALLIPAVAAAEPATQQAIAAARTLTQDEPICAAPTLPVRSKAYLDMMVKIFKETPGLAQFERSYPGIALEASKISQRTNIEIIEARSPALCLALARTLAESLPESDLVTLAAFHDSPVGRKLFGGALQIYLAKAPEWFANPEFVGLAKSQDLSQLFAMQAQFVQKANMEAFAALLPDEQMTFSQFLESPSAQAIRRVTPGNEQRNAELKMRFMADTGDDAQRLATPRIKAAIEARMAAKRRR